MTWSRPSTRVRDLIRQSAQIIVNDSGIYITNGKGASITLIGDVVKVNDGALSVT